jgi:hypothetical protein
VSPPLAWWGLCGLHGAASLLMAWAGQNVPTSAWIWRASDGLQHPLTWWTSAWIHLSTPHLIGNLLAMGGVAAAGWVLRADTRSAWAWALAWPLTQVSLLLWPQVGYATGLSGLMHAGTLLLAVQVALGRLPIRGARFWGGLLILAVVTKVVLERGWAVPLSWDADADIQVVQAAHLAGVFWGVLLGLGLVALGRARRH